MGAIRILWPAPVLTTHHHTPQLLNTYRFPPSHPILLCVDFLTTQTRTTLSQLSIFINGAFLVQQLSFRLAA